MGSKGVGEDIDEMILDRSLKFLMQGDEYLWIHYIILYFCVCLRFSILKCFTTYLLCSTQVCFIYRKSRNLLKMNI